MDFNLSPTLDDEFEIFGGRMSVPGGSSPFIKDEEQEDWFNQPINNHRNLSMHSNPGFGHVPHSSIDPSELSMGSHFSDYHNQGNNSSRLPLGGAILDHELIDLDLNGRGQGRNIHQAQDFYSQGQQIPQANQGMHNTFSTNTPTGDPIQSPFLHGGFNYSNNPNSYGSHMSPGMRSSNIPDYGFGPARTRTSLSHMTDRKSSDTRSPMTPKTPALGALNLSGTPDSGSLPSQPMSALSHRHQKSLSGQWDSTPGLSYTGSPTASPGQNLNHNQISEILKSGKSLPNKIEPHSGTSTYQTQEAKRRRRRESHNMVERRRRDNINERIQELAHLVPQHRLEDDKVRKHLQTNAPSPLSPTLDPSTLGSLPATSLLASGRRAATGAGNITMGIPIEDKDKGPNKGDILNGSVGWTSDLMWCLNLKFQREAHLRELIASLGGVWPFPESDDEKRIFTELMDAVEKNEPETFVYSRRNGSGLRVPKHTNLAGDAVGPNDRTSPSSSVSPGVQIGNNTNNQQSYWNTGNGIPAAFKEEDEYNMQL